MAKKDGKKVKAGPVKLKVMVDLDGSANSNSAPTPTEITLTQASYLNVNEAEWAPEGSLVAKFE